MLVKNTKDTYGVIAITLHWIVALAFIINYAIIYYREWFVEGREDPLFRTLLSYHYAIGVSVLVFVVLRIIWRLTNIQPNEVPGSRLEHLAAMPHTSPCML